MAGARKKADDRVLTSSAVEVLPNDVARAYVHIHPVLIGGIYYYHLAQTIANPTTSLLKLLPYLCLLQLAYTVLCLPPTASIKPQAPSITTSKAASTPRRKHAAGSHSVSIPAKVISAFLSQLVSLLVVTPILTVLIILHGAPFDSLLFHTLLCAAHMATLAATPLFYVHGIDGEKWRELCGLMAPIDAVSGAAIGTAAGAWLGAIPIPLDWDREWQKWPVTVITGAYLGYVVGKVAGGTVFKGKRIFFGTLEEEEEMEDEQHIKLALDLN